MSSSILIRNVDDRTKSRLRKRAARNGRSMESEAREILRRALASEADEAMHLVDRIRRRFERFGGFDLPAIPRGPIPEPPTFEN